MKRWWERLVYGESEGVNSGNRGWSAVSCLSFCLLRVISIPYHFISQIQLYRRQSRRSGGWKAKIISVGNITVGGSGKTPTIIYLSEWLHRQGKRVAIVHSGYGRRQKEEYVMVPGGTSRYTAAHIGDEVSMMGTRLPFAGFAVGADKKRMVMRADLQLKPDFILIDDGFQRLDIEKDCDIVIVSSHLLAQFKGQVAPTNRYLFPRGILRESIRTLRRADLIFLINEPGDVSDYHEFLIKYNPEAKFLSWVLTLSGVEIEGELSDLSALGDRRPYVFAAIGSFYRMMRMLRKSGVSIAGEHNFGDHYAYTENDFLRLKRWSDQHSADCYLTTAKDMVKLPPEAFDKPVFCLHLSLQPVNCAGLDQMIGLVAS